MMCCALVVAERYDGSILAGIYFVSVCSFKCTFERARSKFYQSFFNAIVGKVALESVIIQLISSKCATEACPFLARDQSSVSFAVTRVLMKIFRTRSRDVTDQCQICLVCCLLNIMCF